MSNKNKLIELYDDVHPRRKHKDKRQNKITIKDAQEEYDLQYFETMCRSCQFFNNEKYCPHFGEVDGMTDHEEVKCKKFWP